MSTDTQNKEKLPIWALILFLLTFNMELKVPIFTTINTKILLLPNVRTARVVQVKMPVTKMSAANWFKIVPIKSMPRNLNWISKILSKYQLLNYKIRWMLRQQRWRMRSGWERKRRKIFIKIVSPKDQSN